MTVKEKQENFYRTAINTATTEKTAIVNAYKEQVQRETKDYELSVLDSLAQKKKYETEQIRKNKNTEVAKKALELRHTYSELQFSYQEELFSDVKDGVLAYCSSDQYKNRLIDNIQEAIQLANKSTCVVYVTKRDYPMVSACAALKGIELRESEEDFWGGCKVIVQERNMIINLSYLSKYEECKQQFSFPDMTAREVE